MDILARIIIALIAVLLLYIGWFEMFAWETRGPKVFKSLPKGLFASTKSLAGNQGLYNGFLAAGLIWSLLVTDPLWSHNLEMFFLGCVAIAGVYGALTAEKKILFIQTVPATIAIILLLLPV